MLCRVCKEKEVAPYETDGRCEDCYANNCTGISYTTNIYDEDKEPARQNKSEDEVLMQPIACLELETRERNLMEKNGIYFLEDLIKWSEAELLYEIKGFGEKTLERVKIRLAVLGLKLKQMSAEQRQTENSAIFFP